MDTLLVSSLANARIESNKASQDVNAANAALQLTPEWASLVAAKEAASTAQQKTVAAEAMLRQGALDDYTATGNKNQHEKVIIKLFSVVKYDAAEALDEQLNGDDDCSYYYHPGSPYFYGDN